jgi:hypothetical protein
LPKIQQRKKENKMKLGISITAALSLLLGHGADAYLDHYKVRYLYV